MRRALQWRSFFAIILVKPIVCLHHQAISPTMRYHVTVLPARRIGIVRLSGAIDGGIICAALEGLYTHLNWQPSFNSLWDAASVRALAVSPAEASEIIARIAELAPRRGTGHTALVVRREMDAAFARMICARIGCSQRMTRIFRSLPRAIGWVGQDVRRTPAARTRHDACVAPLAFEQRRARARAHRSP